jgi:thiol-disulfide isomerase/thioredoxin
MRAFLLALVLLAAPRAGCAGGDTEASRGEWAFSDTEDEEHSRESTSGSPTVIFYMATWCPSCEDMTSEMSQVHAEHGEQIDMLSAGVDPGETDQDLETWKNEPDQPWPHGIDQEAQLQRAYGVDSQSSVVVLDDEGVLAEKWGYGEATAEEVSAVLDNLGV